MWCRRERATPSGGRRLGAGCAWPGRGYGQEAESADCRERHESDSCAHGSLLCEAWSRGGPIIHRRRGPRQGRKATMTSANSGSQYFASGLRRGRLVDERQELLDAGRLQHRLDDLGGRAHDVQLELVLAREPVGLQQQRETGGVDERDLTQVDDEVARLGVASFTQACDETVAARQVELTSGCQPRGPVRDRQLDLGGRVECVARDAPGTLRAAGNRDGPTAGGGEPLGTLGLRSASGSSTCSRRATAGLT